MKKIYRVLLAEDDFASAKVVTHTLNKYNFFTEHVENGKLAYEKIQQGSRYDLIITDIMMPEMDGLTMVEKIVGKTNDTPIIMLTAVGDRENVRKAANFNVKMFLLKPISSPKLLEKVKEILKLTEEALVNKRAVPFRYRILGSDSPNWKIEMSGIPFIEFEELLVEVSNRLKKARSLQQIEIEVASEVLYNQRSPHELDNLVKKIQENQKNVIISLTGEYFSYLEKKIFQDMDHLCQCNVTTGGLK